VLLQRQQNIFTAVTNTNEAAVRASFIIPQTTAKKSKPFAGGDYVDECIKSCRSSVLVDVAGQLNNLNKDLQAKDKLIAEMYNSINAFKVKL
jgi:hypothetical protein